VTDRLPASAEIAEAGEIVARVREQLQALDDPAKAAAMAAARPSAGRYGNMPAPIPLPSASS
jgi:hypothetical protein